MRAEYDSEADALPIDLVDVERWDQSDEIDSDDCRVALAGGKPANVELLSPAEHLDLLATAASKHGLDQKALEAAAQSALAAPDRPILLEVLTSA